MKRDTGVKVRAAGGARQEKEIPPQSSVTADVCPVDSDRHLKGRQKI